MTLQDLLNKVCNGNSDGKTSQRLGITRSMFSAYRNGRKKPSNEVIDRMIDLSGVDPVQAYMAVYAERIENPLVVKAFRNPSAIFNSQPQVSSYHMSY